MCLHRFCKLNNCVKFCNAVMKFHHQIKMVTCCIQIHVVNTVHANNAATQTCHAARINKQTALNYCVPPMSNMVYVSIHVTINV